MPPRRTPSRRGSLADVPKNLLDQIKELERQFTVPGEKLKEITDHWVSELEKGLEKDDGPIPQNPSWVMAFPDGNETGTYLALDMGGTNLRVCEVTLVEEKGEFDIIQSKYRMPEELKTTDDQEELWDYIADCVQQFIAYHHAGETMEPLPMGFTFSYPATQNAIDHGVLQRWTKGFDIAGVEGTDVVIPFEAALKKRNLPVELTCIVNDTVGTMIATAYTDPTVRIGHIFGTGCNAAYIDNIGHIPKLKHMGLADDVPMAVNCEYGSFDNAHKVLPITPYDRIVDKESPRPGQQAMEKMTAGLYLGEIFRLVLCDLSAPNADLGLFKDQDLKHLQKQYSLDSSFLSMIEEDPFENLSETHELFKKQLSIDTTKPELELIRRLAELVGTRAARISHCGVAALCKMKGWTECHVGADGSVFTRYPHFKQRGAQALREIFGWTGRKDPIEVIPSEDGSGVGAALIAALTQKRTEEGIWAGINDRERFRKKPAVKIGEDGSIQS